MAKIPIHVAAILALAAVCAGQPDGPASRTRGESASGLVHTYISTNSTWDPFTDSPTPAMQEWFQQNAWRMLVFSPYFDQRLSWYPNGWAYLDLYAIYPGSSVASLHPNWILKDQHGNPLYIPYDCSGGTCPQYAGDITNPDFRAYWLSQAASYFALGYRGLWIDDVNLEFRVSDGNGNEVTPVDPNTGRLMTLANWESYVSSFTQQIRAAFPAWQIIHNAIWYAGVGGFSDPLIQQEINAADYINLERGTLDPGLTGGSGQYSFTAFLSYIDYVHSVGRSVVLDNPAGQIEYAMAGYFLISTGSDGMGSSGLTPDTWPAAFAVDLGNPEGPRGTWNGLLYRLFAHGMVLVNPPGNPSVTINPVTSLQEIGSTTDLGTFTLGPADGLVLLYGSPRRPSTSPRH